MDERLQFVARLLDGEKMAALCREVDVSRKTGYKIFQRYKDCGLEGLTDRSRRPYRQANQPPFQIERRGRAGILVQVSCSSDNNIRIIYVSYRQLVKRIS